MSKSRAAVAALLLGAIALLAPAASSAAAPGRAQVAHFQWGG